ncbi:hypothetical protein Q1695_011390 [Nippostrongylus brasiliensis]|nr:hypothetical protein Q1695_011390 [Nippostrongylus brasiliensis]
MPPEFIDEKWPAEILSKLASFREFDEFCDVNLEADGSSKAESEPTPSTSIRAHKFVLAAASPYFREKLSSDSYVESKEICVVVKDIDDKTLRLLVDYMYTGRLDINENNVRALYGAAEILHLDSVRSECSWYLKEHLSVSNCMEIAAFAKAHNCTELDDAAVSFAGQHFGSIARLFQFHGEDEVFEAVINWVKRDSSRQASLPNVIVGVHLPLMSREFLDRVYSEPMRRESSACMGMLGTVFHDMLSEEKTSRVPENWYRLRQTKMVMIAGGVTESAIYLADVNIYDPYSQQWTPAAPLLQPRGFFGMATAEESVYAVGGRNTETQNASLDLRSVEIYDSQRDLWRAGPEMQRRRCGPGVTALNGTIFAVGGVDISETLREAEMLDPRQGEWISLPSMMNGRYRFGLAAANGLLYAVAGKSGNQFLNSVEVYDPRAHRWTTAQPILKKRYDAGVTVFRDQVVVVGGFDMNGRVLSPAEMLTDNGWMSLPEMSVPRQGHGVVNVNGSLFAFGGWDDEGCLSSIEYLDFDSNQWEMSQACRDATEDRFLWNHTLVMSRILWNHPV